MGAMWVLFTPQIARGDVGIVISPACSSTRTSAACCTYYKSVLLAPLRPGCCSENSILHFNYYLIHVTKTGLETQSEWLLWWSLMVSPKKILNIGIRCSNKKLKISSLCLFIIITSSFFYLSNFIHRVIKFHAPVDKKKMKELEWVNNLLIGYVFFILQYLKYL